MAVPSQNQFHRPVLELVRDSQGGVVSLQQIIAALTQQFSMDEKDLAETISSGQKRFTNRARWAVFYLKESGLVESPSRAHFRITDQGRQILATHSGDLGMSLLKGLMTSRRVQRPLEYRETDEGAKNGVTPDEQMEVLYNELNDRLADELMDVVGKMHPDRFERLVVRLLEKMGYGRGERVGKSGDGGIDGIIDQDQLGLEKVYIQAKRWQNPVGAPDIFSFSGSLNAKGASKGVFITTSSFGTHARDTARNISAGNQFIRLIDGGELAQLMIRYDVGVITETTYHIKKLDENYLSEEL